MYISYKLLPVKSSTTAYLLPVWGVSLLTSYKLLPGYCISVTCQITIMQLSLFKATIQKHVSCSSIPQIKGNRPLDTKSIAHLVKSFVIKGNTMTLKMRMSTFLTEKR